MLTYLPNEILLNEICDRLPVETLVTMSTVSRTLHQRLNYVTRRRLEVEEVEQREIDIYMKSIEIEQNVMETQFKYIREILLSKKLTSAMGLIHMPLVDGQAVYNMYLLMNWWSLYIRTNKLNQGINVYPDEFMKSLFDSQFSGSIPITFAQCYNFFSSHIRGNTAPITPIIKASLYREELDLKSYKTIIQKKK